MQQGFARDLSAGHPGPSANLRIAKLSNRRSSLSLADDASRSPGAGGTKPAPGARSASPKTFATHHATPAADSHSRVGLIEQSTRAHGFAVGSTSTRPAGNNPAGVPKQGEAI